MTNINAAHMQNIFDIPQAERKANVVHDGKFYDFGAGFVVFEVVYFAHEPSLARQMFRIRILI